MSTTFRYPLSTDVSMRQTTSASEAFNTNVSSNMELVAFPLASQKMCHKNFRDQETQTDSSYRDK